MQNALPENASVLVIDDHPLFRKGVLELLASTPHLKPAGEADTGEKGVELAHRLQPDLILLDLHMRSGQDGIATLRKMRAEGIEARIIVLTVSDAPRDLVDAMRSGADGYLLKDTDPELMLHYLQESLYGKTVLSEGLAQMLVSTLSQDPGGPIRQLADLTDRETTILYCLSQGLSNKMIARELDIMESTVKVHIRNLLKKLKFHSRVEAAVWAVSQGVSSR